MRSNVRLAQSTGSAYDSKRGGPGNFPAVRSVNRAQQRDTRIKMFAYHNGTALRLKREEMVITVRNIGKRPVWALCAYAFTVSAKRRFNCRLR